jgi:hypothetical protein
LRAIEGLLSRVELTITPFLVRFDLGLGRLLGRHHAHLRQALHLLQQVFALRT